MTLEELNSFAILADNATPGPWYVRYMGDDACMSAVAISTEPDSGEHEDLEAWPPHDHDVIAACLIQHPPYVIPRDRRWQENAEFLVAVRNAMPELIRLARIGLANS